MEAAKLVYVNCYKTTQRVAVQDLSDLMKGEGFLDQLKALLNQPELPASSLTPPAQKPLLPLKKVVILPCGSQGFPKEVSAGV